MELWELVARESIRDRIARWNSNGDAGRMAEMVKVLAPDVEFSIADGEFLHGRDEVLQSLLGVRDGKAPSDTAPAATGRYLPPGKQPSIRHYTSNPTIDFESDSRARVRTYYAVLSSFGLDHWGRYLDEFGLVDGEWLITKRTVTTEGVDPDGVGRGPRMKIVSETLGDLFEEIGTREPDGRAYVDGEQRLTYGQWLAGADSLAAELRARGVRPGDVVAFWLSSCIDYTVAYAACTRLGAVATGINTRLGPAELTAILQRCEPVALLHEGDTFAVPGDAPTPKIMMPRSEVATAWAAGTELTDRPRRDPADPVCIVWTSGTTGLPKGAWFDHRALEASARLSNILSAYHDVRLMPVPFPHAGYMNKLWDQVEFVINSVLTGTPWTVETMLDSMVSERVTVGQGVPTQWSKLVDLPQLADADLSSLRLASTGSAPVTPELAEKMRTRLGCPIVVRYACTESSSITGTRVDDPPEVLLHTVGRPQEGIELVLRDDAGEPVPQGEVGVVTLRSPCSMGGYWNDPERTADTLAPDGWITTSDLGLLRDDGNLVLRGRTSEMYIRGGFNIHPLEVERVVADHPKVSRVAIVGTPAPTIGEIGVAFVEPVDPADPPTLEELRAFVRERLADYKAPDQLEVVAELPMTAMLKIDKRVLQDQLAQAD